MPQLLTAFACTAPSTSYRPSHLNARGFRSPSVPVYKQQKVRPTQCTRVLDAGTHSSFQPVDESVVRVVERRSGNRVTPSDVATISGLSVLTARGELARLASLACAAIDVANDGDLENRIVSAWAKLRAASLLYAVSIVLQKISDHEQNLIWVCFSAMFFANWLW